jgi:hypothetical protein
MAVGAKDLGPSTKLNLTGYDFSIRKSDLKDNHKLLGGWMRPRSFSFIVYAGYLEAFSKSSANSKGAQ